MRRILVILLSVVSLSGWGIYFYTVAGNSQAEQRIFDNVFSRMEEQWKVEDSLKQDVETQKRNALFLRQQEFEREVETSGLQFQEEMKNGMQEWFADMQGDTVKRQAEQSVREEEFRKKTGDSLNALSESMRQEIKKNESVFLEQNSRRMEDDRKRLEELRAEFHSQLQEIMSAREKEQILLKAEREKGRREIDALTARLAEAESRAGELSAQVKALQKPPVPGQEQGR